MSDTSFPALFARGSVGKIRTSNRVAMLPMGTAYASAIGEITQKTIDHYVERARGGVGLVITGNCSPFGRIGPNQLVLDADWFMAGHYELVEAVHAEGVPIVLQLNHPGRNWNPKLLDGKQPVSSSDIPAYFLGEHAHAKPRPLEKEEIYDIIQRWADGAARAKKVGYDAIEFHGAHGYLIEQFMSPYANRRTDEFGGTVENRMRFPLELIKGVKKAVGDSFPLGFRFGAEEFVPDGITIQDSPGLAKMLEAAGIAYLSVTCGVPETHHKTTDTFGDPEGWKAYIWEAIKRSVGIPVIAGGGLRTPAFCETILAQGKADFIGLARPLLADPYWPSKAREGRAEDIRPCLSCGECNHWSARPRQGGGARRCSVNAATGRERDFAQLRPAAIKKRVMVIGGGPGGMEAAHVAALRGHDVTLYEKDKELGGALLVASVPPGKNRIEVFRQYLLTQIAKAGVRVKLSIEVTPEAVQKENPDTIIVATGSSPIASLPCTAGKGFTTAWDVLSGKAAIKNKKVVVVGGGMVGAETADYLAGLGNTVTIVEMLPAVAADMEQHNRYALLKRLETSGVKLLTRKEVVGLEEGVVTVADKDNGEKTSIEADEVVLAVGAQPNKALAEAIEAEAREFYVIGDCKEPRIILEAVYEGSMVARRI